MWTSAVAWQVSLIMGTQATYFYLLVTWLPTIEVSLGVDPVTAGWHSFLYQIVGIAAGLGVTPLMRGRSDHRAVGVAISAAVDPGDPRAAARAGAAPALAGARRAERRQLAGARTRPGRRTSARTPADASRLSGMAQCVGYLSAAAGPWGAGLLFAATGSWTSRCSP